MSLTSALNIAQSALFNTSRQTSTVSRNITEASNPDYSRRSAVLTSLTPGGARIAQIERAANEALFRQNLYSISSFQGQNALVDGLDRLQLQVNGADNASSPATQIANLQEALEFYSATPSNGTLAENVVETARQTARTLNQGTSAIQRFRGEMDAEIAASVDDLNRLLDDFGDINREIVAGTHGGKDVSDALDRRDAIMKKISEYVPVTTLKRADNDLVLMTKDGATLFETVPRSVTFQPQASYSAGTTGNGVYIDGVAMQPGSGGNTSAGGLIAARLQLRDDVAVDMQQQLDEIARGLIETFAESDPSGTLADQTGLFTWPGGPALPASGTLQTGLAGTIRVNAAVDSTAGGDPSLLRDGGINGAAYVHNTTGAASYSDLLRSLGDRMEAPMAFDAAVGLGATASLTDYTSQSIGWLEAMRQDASRGLETKDALATRTETALSNATGVNMDEEMARLLELEHSYEASARLIRVVDEMLATLLAAAG